MIVNLIIYTYAIVKYPTHLNTNITPTKAIKSQPHAHFGTADISGYALAEYKEICSLAEIGTYGHTPLLC